MAERGRLYLLKPIDGLEEVVVDVTNYLECCFFGTVTWPALLYCKILLSETCGMHWSSYGKLECDVYSYLLRLL